MVTIDLNKEQAEMLRRSLDSLAMGALSIYDVAKVLPHPYNAVGDMANHWSHDFLNTVSHLGKVLDKVIAEES